ncbi:MAG: hypothetical protein BMS9Abin37_0295 [Acidobacteriota bacterium]|nr:MAG: hypothetical protein BMS9Abin37_0295 [Acidobacteriota bacterium]
MRRVTRVSVLAAACFFTTAATAATAPANAHPRVILVSWDGAGYALTSRLLAEGRMPNLTRMLREGAWTDGMVSSFPTKTAAAHAVLFTGYYGHQSGITGNSVLMLPASEHNRLETSNGYFSTALRVDPVWVRVARAGLDAYVVHATQSYPFETALRDLDADERRHLFLIHGYTEVQLRGETWNERSAPLELPSGWTIPEARGGEARAFRFTVGDASFWGLFFDDPMDPTEGIDTLGVVRNRVDTEFEARVKTGTDGGFSTPIVATAAGTDVWFSLRLFDVSTHADRFLLYRSGAVEMALSNPDTPKADYPLLQVYAGNSATGAYTRGEFGPTRSGGGDGTAEARFHETLVHLQEQIMRQASVALDEDYSLVVLYSPVTDDVAHELVGLLDPTLDGYDEERAAAHWEDIAKGFELQDRYLGVILEAAERDAAHVIVVSDHGMSGTDRLVYLNVVLEQAGLLTLNPDRTIDLSATRALAPPLADGSIAVNTTDRAGGIVPPEERDEVLALARKALSALTDPVTGEPVITAFFEPAWNGLLQPGGLSTGDLFLEFAPRYYPTDWTDADVAIERTEPRGNHIFVPTRREMLAICAAWGPRVRPSINWGKVRSIDIVPTVLDLLELEVPADMPGRSLVPARTLLESNR